MSLYRLDRFAAASAALTAAKFKLLAGGSPLEKALALTPAPPAVPVPEKTSQPVSDQAKADAELAQLEQQRQQIETEVEVTEVGDPGAPEPTSPLIYIGLGVGALVLIGGAYFVAKPKAKLSGHKRRRRSRRRRHGRR